MSAFGGGGGVPESTVIEPKVTSVTQPACIFFDDLQSNCQDMSTYVPNCTSVHVLSTPFTPPPTPYSILCREPAQTAGITEANISFLYEWIEKNKDKPKIAIFDWDNTISTCSGICFSKNPDKTYDDSPKQLGIMIDHLLGGPERTTKIKSMFLHLMTNKVEVYILTKNLSAKEGCNERPVFVKLIQTICPQFDEKNLICSSGSGYTKSEAYLIDKQQRQIIKDNLNIQQQQLLSFNGSRFGGKRKTRKTRNTKSKNQRKTKNRKPKTKKLIIGGNPPTTITEFAELNDPNDYSQIYIGIGAKYIHYTEGQYDSYFISRAQLLPRFLNRDGSKSLIVLIDEFNELELAATIAQIHDINVPAYNYDICILNSKFTEDVKTALCEYLGRKTEITQDNLWICNYVKFYSPNTDEILNRDAVESLCKSITKDTKLKDCVYMWLQRKKFLINYESLGCFIVMQQKLCTQSGAKPLAKLGKNLLNFVDDTSYCEPRAG